MFSDIWYIISNFLDEKDISNLIKIKIISNEYICKICSLEKEIVIDDYIYCKYNFFDNQLGIERKIKKRCGLYINNICSICGHVRNKKIKARKINQFSYELWKAKYSVNNYV